MKSFFLISCLFGLLSAIHDSQSHVAPRRLHHSKTPQNASLSKRGGTGNSLAPVQAVAVAVGGCIGSIFGPFGGVLAGLTVGTAYLGTSLGGAATPEGVWNSIKGFARAQTDDQISKKLNDDKAKTLLGYIRVIEQRAKLLVANLKRWKNQPNYNQESVNFIT